MRESLIGRMTKDERRRAHEWAAAFYGRPFVEMVRRAAAQSGKSWTEEQIESLARGRKGRGADGSPHRRPGPARAAMGRSLAWHTHLFAAGEYEAASDIVTAVFYILARWGERDRAKALLRGSIETLEGANKAVAQGNLATLLKDEGKLAEALATCEEVYRMFEAAGAKQQMAAVLSTNGYHLSEAGQLRQGNRIRGTQPGVRRKNAGTKKARPSACTNLHAIPAQGGRRGRAGPQPGG